MNLDHMINVIEFASSENNIELVAKGGYKRVVAPCQISIFEEHVTLYPKNMSARRTKTILFSDLKSVRLVAPKGRK